MVLNKKGFFMLLLKFTLFLLSLQNLFFMFYVRSEFNCLRTTVNCLRTTVTILQDKLSFSDICKVSHINYNNKLDK